MIDFKCSKCGKPLEQVTDLKQLHAMPFEWYLDPDVVEREVILHCPDCKMFKVLSYFDKLKFRVANKIMGQGD